MLTSLFHLAHCLQVSSMLEPVSELPSFLLLEDLCSPLWVDHIALIYSFVYRPLCEPKSTLVSMTGTLMKYLCCPFASSGFTFHVTEVFCCDRSLTARTRDSELREKTRSGPISQMCSCSAPRQAHPGPCPCCLAEWPTPKAFLVPFLMWTQSSSGLWM